MTDYFQTYSDGRYTNLRLNSGFKSYCFYYNIRGMIKHKSGRIYSESEYNSKRSYAIVIDLNKLLKRIYLTEYRIKKLKNWI